MPVPPTRSRLCACRAFTLIELLAVMALMTVLTGIAWGAVRGGQNRAKLAAARSQLAILTLALEAYKREYGDYPRTGGRVQASAEISGPPSADAAQCSLLDALRGKLNPRLEAILGPTFLETSRLTLESGDDAAANCLVDPWGRRYLYYHRSDEGGTWAAPGYVLYSAGPDGRDEPPAADGSYDAALAANADNVYASR